MHSMPCSHDEHTSVRPAENMEERLNSLQTIYQGNLLSLNTPLLLFAQLIPINLLLSISLN
jgi:hypothetical protein